MKASVAVAKEADAKKGVSPTRSDKSIHRVRDEPERQLGSLRGVIGNITRNGGTPSVESIAAELSGMPTGERAPALLALQQTHGNRYVQRVVTGIQAKLKVGQPGDVYEQEADRVADAVMRMPEPQVPRQAEEEEEDLIQTGPIAEQITPLVQGQVKGVEGEKILQTKEVSGQGFELTSDFESLIQPLRVAGQPLPQSERTFFEPHFGTDFTQVRVHTDSQASKTARSVNARAVTLGRDIIFGAGQYQPRTYEGRRLLAHELTHVVQQNSSAQTSLLQRWEERPLPLPPIITEPLIGGGSRSYSPSQPLRSYTPSRTGAAALGAAQTAEESPRWTFRRFREGNGQQMNPTFWSVTYHLILRQLNARLSDVEISISNEGGRTALENVRSYLEEITTISWSIRNGYPISRIEIRLRSDVTPIAAANDLVNPSSAPHYAFECYTAAALIQFVGVWRGLQGTVPESAEATFNRRYADFRVEHADVATVHMGGEEVEGTLGNQLGEFNLFELSNDPEERGLIRGDWIFLDNGDLISEGPFQGENATYLGNNRFHGHGIGVFNIYEYVRALRRRIPPESSGLTLDEILERIIVRPYY